VDNKITKSRLKNLFRYDWLKLVALLLVAIFVPIIGFTFITNPKSSEIISVFVVCDVHNDAGLKASAEKYLKENVSNNMITEVRITYVSPTDVNYRTLYTVNGGNACTIMILPEFEMKQTAFSIDPPLVKASDYDADTTGGIADKLSEFGAAALSEEMKEYYFDTPLWRERVFVYEYEGEETQETRFQQSVSGNVYGLRIDDLSSRYKFKHYVQTNDEKGYAVEQDEGGNDVYEKGYLVINVPTLAYSVGKWGASASHYSHTETFALAAYIFDYLRG
jgi:hypothetical protein